MLNINYKSDIKNYCLIQGNNIDILSNIQFQFDMIFADPPYFLSNGGISVSNGKKVCVDKGDWDKGGTPDYIQKFNREWLTACRDKLKDNGTIWVSGTHHNIFSVADILSELGFKILNVVTWAKTNPPENLSHRMLTHSSEFIIWAKKTQKAHHQYNYEIMQGLNDGKQMTDVWFLPAVQKWEKSCGKHPTQKPLALLARIILASTKENDWILDPFCGSGTTGITANLLKRKFLGIDQDTGYLELAKNRREELNNNLIFQAYLEKVLAESHASSICSNSSNVLIGRVGSDSQWKWIMSSSMYNLPISKVISTPKLLSVEYVLLFPERHSESAELFHVGKIRPQIRSKEYITELAKNEYLPHRDSSYWILHLAKYSNTSMNGKRFHLSNLVPNVSNRGAYWIFPLEDVLKAYIEE